VSAEIEFHRSLISCGQTDLSVLRSPERRDEAPLLLILHGALASSKGLRNWAATCWPEFDVALVDLPGHGESPAATPTIPHFANILSCLISGSFAARSIVVVGESLGGLIALALGSSAPANVRAVVAADPPLATMKLLYVIRDLKNALAKWPNNLFLRDLALNVFGVSATPTRLEERNYYGLLKDLKLPALILTGDVQFGSSQGAHIPCALDESDRTLIRECGNELVMLKIIPNAGHRVLKNQPQATLAAIREFLAGVSAQ
jgi:pimeloyl-ACP methyl ester carboxylesterase